MAIINTNMKALFSQVALNGTERKSSIAMQQLSTGKRINSARDDAAGMAISTRMTQQIRGLNMAVRNAGDAISLIQTAEGATNEITDMMQRMRELAVQAVNDTNDNAQRSYLDLEFQQLKQQIVQISDNTEWNGFSLLNGMAGEQVGEMPVFKTTSQNLYGGVFIDPKTTRSISGTDAGKLQTIQFGAASGDGTIVVDGINVAVNHTDTANDVAYKVYQALIATDKYSAGSGRTLTDPSTTTTNKITVKSTISDGDYPDISMTDTTSTGVLLKQVQEIQFSLPAGVAIVGTPKINVGGVSVDLAAGDTATAIATKVRTALLLKAPFIADGITVSIPSAGRILVEKTNPNAAFPTISFDDGGTGLVATDNIPRRDAITISTESFTGNGKYLKSGVLTISTTHDAAARASIAAKFVTDDNQTINLDAVLDEANGTVSFDKLIGSNGLIFSDNLVLNLKKTADPDPVPVILNNRDFSMETRVSGAIPAMQSGDLLINGTNVGGSYAVDDLVSPPNNASGSAISKAAAINRVASDSAASRGESQSITFSGNPVADTTITVGGVPVLITRYEDTATKVAAKIASSLQTSFEFGASSKRVITYASGGTTVNIDYPITEGNVNLIKVDSGTSNILGAPSVTSKFGAKVPGTGVYAKVNENVFTGKSQSGTSAVTGVVFINGFASANITTTINNPQETRNNVVRAINMITSKTGVKAIDSGSVEKGITLVAADGRNIEVQFETNVNSSIFGDRIGMREGVQSSTISLESKIPAPVVLTSTPNGDISRVGLMSGNFSKNQSVYNTVARPPVVYADPQVNKVTITGPIDTTADQYTLTINGHAFQSALPNNASPQEIRQDLIDQINDISAPYTGVKVSAGMANGELLLTAMNPGIPFTLTTDKTSTATGSIDNQVVTPNKTPDYKVLGANDLKINGFTIRPTTTADDLFSSPIADSSSRAASAIALTNAINDSSAVTGVRAVANPAVIKGIQTDRYGPDTGIQSLFINGVQCRVNLVNGEEATDRRDKIVAAINERTGQHGVIATNNGNGITLNSDGRNISTWYDSSVSKLSASCFGLDTGTAVKQVSKVQISDPAPSNITSTDTRVQITLNGVVVTSDPTGTGTTPYDVATALKTAIDNQLSDVTSRLYKNNISVEANTDGSIFIRSTIAGAGFEVSGAKVFEDATDPPAIFTDSVSVGIGTLTANSSGDNAITAIYRATELSSEAKTVYGTVRLIAATDDLPNLQNPADIKPASLRSYGKPFSISSGDDGFSALSNFSGLGFQEGQFGGRSSQAMDAPRVGRLAFQVGASAKQTVTIDFADFGKGGDLTGAITGDVDQAVEERSVRINTREGATAVLSLLDISMDKVNATRATMGAVMNRLDHVINNLSNVSMNMSASRSQVEDSDYAQASTELAKSQIMQQAATAVLAQANTSQQSVLKLLQG